MYNTDVAAQAGVLGSDGQLEEITSPDRFLEVMRAMQAVTGEHALSYGYLGDGAQMWRLFYTFYKQMGGDMELPTGGEVVYDRDKAVASLEYIQTLLDGTIATPSGDAGTAIAEFAGAKSGAIVTGVWELPTFQKAKVPFDAMPIPNLFGTPATFADSHAFVLPHQSSPDPVKREKTYAFVADLLKNSLQWAGAGHIPAYKPIVDSPEYAELLPQAHYADAAAQIEYDPVAYFTGSGSDFQTYFAENVQNVFLGRQEAGVGLDASSGRSTRCSPSPTPCSARPPQRPIDLAVAARARRRTLFPAKRRRSPLVTTAAPPTPVAPAAGPASPRPAVGQPKVKAKEQTQGLLFIAPFLITFLVFLVWPVLYGFYQSLTGQSLTGANSELIGFANYFEAFGDSQMWRSLGNTVVFTIASTIPSWSSASCSRSS
ncbi:hypothetical protein MAFF212519_21330 [Clavibacter michiganensis]